MSAVLTHHAYGKSRVRLTKVIRHADRHEIRELDVDIHLEGDFVATYTVGDNHNVIATDTMKNVVYALAHDHPLGPIERFAEALAKHFVEGYEQVHVASIRVDEHPWQRVSIGGRDHPHSFTGGTTEVRTAVVTNKRDSSISVSAGIQGLLLLKTTRSAFSGFVRDQYTTLPESSDRIFATELKAEWRYDARADDFDFDEAFSHVRRALVETFAEHDSLSVQQTLHVCGIAALDACATLEQITLTMPNKHRILFDLSPFGVANHNEIFVAMDEPFGLITGTVSRS
jgi:urate oxidase